MTAVSELPQVNRRVRLRAVALPLEHGGWGLLLEPILLGLLLAPSLAGLFISISATAAFLARHPFKLAMTDRHRQRVTRRTRLAQRLALAYAAGTFLTFALAVQTGGKAFLLPLVLAAPIAIVQLSYDSVGKSRALIAELAGSLSTAALATAIAICGGWPRPMAFVLWALVSARSAPTILYLRARLRLIRHKPASPGIVIGAHFAGVLLAIALAWLAAAPLFTVVAMGILLIRAFVGLQSSKRTTPQRLGVGELAFGVITVAAISIGFRFGW